jgi:hypothetical protein
MKSGKNKAVKFESESELAGAVVRHIREDGWEVWQEVQLSSYSAIADIVAYRAPVYWIIECKLRFGLEVVDQACNWRRFAHYISVSVPYVSDRSGSGTLNFVCKHFGIGVIEVGKRGDWSTGYSVYDHRSLTPTLMRKPPSIEQLKNGLRDEHKTWAEAGNSSGRRYTPFADTCYGLARVVAAIPGISFAEALGKIKHHYSTDQSARSSLLKWIEAGRVKDVKVIRSGKAIHLYHPDAVPEDVKLISPAEA